MEGPSKTYTRPRHLISRGFADSFSGFGPAAPRIVARRWGDFEVRDPVGAVVIIHGLAEHSGKKNVSDPTTREGCGLVETLKYLLTYNSQEDTRRLQRS
jgi:hypothetical protein